MFNPYFLLKLSDSEKKALIIVAIIFAFIFVMIGLLIKVIKDWYKDKGSEIDNYMYDLVKYGIIKNPHQFRKYVNKREKRNLYLRFKIPMRILLITITVFVIFNLTYTSFNTSFAILKDLSYHFSWPTVEIFGIRVISDWPKVIKYPEVHLTLEGYITYISFVVTCITTFFLIKATLIYNACIARATFVSSKAFKKNLENGVDIIHE
ncbi:MAG: hypothetical protein SO253_01975 [Bacilli bacterium]|nr:hypothetical protein [Bacilli bacterium]